VLLKEIAQALIEPALAQKQPVRLLCREGSLEPLLAAPCTSSTSCFRTRR
jgi:hypothetical protein